VHINAIGLHNYAIICISEVVIEYMIKGFPLGPSSNSMYAAVNGRLIKSSESRIYDKQCQMWGLKNWKVLEAIKKAVESTKLPYAVELDCTFVFLHARLVGKKNQLKKLDAMNRMKNSIDNFCKVAQFDDSLIVGGAFKKITCDNSRDEQVIFNLRLTQLQTLDQILESVSFIQHNS